MMFRLSQIVAYFSDNSPERRFKPWWEDVTDCLTHALLIIATLSWTFLLQDYTAGISCILEDPRTSTVFNNVYAKYFSQKCALEVFNGCFTYYPTLALFEWMIFLFCQIFMLKLPSVMSKIEVADQILEMLDQSHKQGNKPQRVKQSEALNCNIPNARRIEDYAKLRLLFLLKDKGITISTIYGCKNLVTLCLASTFIVLIFHHFPRYTELWEKQNISYNRLLLYGNARIKNLQMFCNLGCGRITFILICLNVCVLSSFIVMSFIGHVLLMQKRIKAKKSIQMDSNGKIKFQAALEDISVIIGLINAKRQYDYTLMQKINCLIMTLVSNSYDDEILETGI